MKINSSDLSAPISTYDLTVTNEKEQISVDVPIVSKNLQRNVLFAAVTAVALTALYYTVIRPPLLCYNADIARIQNTIKCMENEPKVSSMPGCMNNVYCINKDRGFDKFGPFYPVRFACANNDDMSILFKTSAENTIRDYRNSTSYAKQLFDKFYFETVVRFAP